MVGFQLFYLVDNYYIGYANKVARSSDEYIPKWKYEYDMENLRGRYDELADAARIDYERQDPEVKVIVNGHRYNVI